MHVSRQRDPRDLVLEEARPALRVPDGLAANVTLLTAAVPGWRLASVMACLAESGVRTIELLVGPGTEIERAAEPELARTRSELERFGLDVCGVAAPASWPVGSAELRGAVEIASALGAGFVRAFAPPYEPLRPPVDQLAEVARALDNLRTRTVHLSVDVLLETAQETVVPSPELARRVIEEASPQHLGVVYDPANMAVEGNLQARYAVSYLGSLLRHVHAKNQVFVRRDGGWRRKRTQLDRGYVDWADVAAALAEHAYDGFVSIDHLSGQPTRARLREDLEMLRRLLAEGTRRAVHDRDNEIGGIR